MIDELMVGTVGWDHDAWQGTYYPDDLPRDWRFGYYSNDYRAVLVPAGHFPVHDLSRVNDWLEDSDAAFRFVLQLPPALLTGSDTGSLAGFLEQIEPLLTRTAGFLLSPDEIRSDPDTLASRLATVCARGPVCIEPVVAGGTTNVPDSLRNRLRIAHCWDPVCHPAPVAGGALMVVISETAEPKEQRRVIERLGEWMQLTGGRAGLFFTGPAAPAAARSARLIAEMLGI